MLCLMDRIAVPVHSSENFGCFLSPDKPLAWGPKHPARSQTRGLVLFQLHREAVTGWGGCVRSGDWHRWQAGLEHFGLPGTAGDRTAAQHAGDRLLSRGLATTSGRSPAPTAPSAVLLAALGGRAMQYCITHVYSHMNIHRLSLQQWKMWIFSCKLF